jgi:hypothetical protein
MTEEKKSKNLFINLANEAKKKNAEDLVRNSLKVSIIGKYKRIWRG